VNADEIARKVELHGKFTRNEDGGERWVCAWGEDLRGAKLRGADLRGAKLRGADLSGADLSGADLRGAKLRGADLRWANLSEADLRWANLREADLRDANLRDANLRGADLFGANLSDADLSGADLRGADLAMAMGDQFVVFQAGKHQAIFAGGYGHIGCERHTYDDWLARYQEIGAADGYTQAEIERYGAFIQLAVAYLRTVEPQADGAQ
jgi:hypothetical protein